MLEYNFHLNLNFLRRDKTTRPYLSIFFFVQNFSATLVLIVKSISHSSFLPLNSFLPCFCSSNTKVSPGLYLKSASRISNCFLPSNTASKYSCRTFFSIFIDCDRYKSNLVDLWGIEPQSSECHSLVLPLNYRPVLHSNSPIFISSINKSAEK